MIDKKALGSLIASKIGARQAAEAAKAPSDPYAPRMPWGGQLEEGEDVIRGFNRHIGSTPPPDRWREDDPLARDPLKQMNYQRAMADPAYFAIVKADGRLDRVHSRLAELEGERLAGVGAAKEAERLERVNAAQARQAERAAAEQAKKDAIVDAEAQRLQDARDAGRM